MSIDKDPTGDIYKLLDEAGLNGGNLLDSSRPMAKIVNQVRTDLAMKLKSYIVRRDVHMYAEGAKTRPVERKIDVKTIK